MQTVHLTIEEAKALYPTATKERKTELLAAFGKDAFKVKITSYKNITTIEAVFEATGADPNAAEYTVGDPSNIALSLMRLIAKALNPEGWKAVYDGKQHNWFPWFWMDSPGFRFGGSGCANTHSGSAGGSRTLFAEKAISDHAANYFLDIYKAFYI